MKVKALRNVKIAGKFYVAGAVIDCSADAGNALLGKGYAERVAGAGPPPVPPPPRLRKATKKEDVP